MKDERVKNKAGALRQIEASDTRVHSVIATHSRCVAEWSRFRKAPEELLKDINSIKVLDNGKEDKTKTLEARKQAFERTYGTNSRKYHFSEEKGIVVVKK